MQIDEAGIARRLRVTIGHADSARFLKRQHVVDIVGPVAEERQFGRAGIAEHRLDAEGSKQVERGLLDSDGFACGFAILRHGFRPLLLLTLSAPPVTARSSCDEAIQIVTSERFWIVSLRSQ